MNLLRRRMVVGTMAGLSAMLTPGRASACGVWALADDELDLTIAHTQAQAQLRVVRRTEQRVYRVRRIVYGLRGGKLGYAWFRPARRRLFEIDDGALLHDGVAVGRIDGDVLQMGDLEYRVEISDPPPPAPGDDPLPGTKSVILYKEGSRVAGSEAALEWVCGGGVCLRRRLIFHAAWRERIWPLLRQALVDGRHLPDPEPRE